MQIETGIQNRKKKTNRRFRRFLGQYSDPFVFIGLDVKLNL